MSVIFNRHVAIRSLADPASKRRRSTGTRLGAFSKPMAILLKDNPIPNHYAADDHDDEDGQVEQLQSDKERYVRSNSRRPRYELKHVLT
jgi:hypothetical protein